MPASVGMTPATSQGWRPISVKIQPKEIPNSGSSGIAAINVVHSFDGFGERPFRVTHSRSRPINIPAPPKIIMNRNDQ